MPPLRSPLKTTLDSLNFEVAKKTTLNNNKKHTQPNHLRHPSNHGIPVLPRHSWVSSEVRAARRSKEVARRRWSGARLVTSCPNIEVSPWFGKGHMYHVYMETNRKIQMTKICLHNQTKKYIQNIYYKIKTHKPYNSIQIKSHSLQTLVVCIPEILSRPHLTLGAKANPPAPPHLLRLSDSSDIGRTVASLRSSLLDTVPVEDTGRVVASGVVSNCHLGGHTWRCGMFPWWPEKNHENLRLNPMKMWPGIFFCGQKFLGENFTS